MITLFTILLAALALGILVFVHELGHYFVAKWVGMNVEVFSIGFGHPLVKWRWQQVDWQLGWLPFGGYVKITGMDFGKKEGGSEFDEKGSFFSTHPIKRILVALAGPCANFILAFIIFLGIWALGGRTKPFSEHTQIIGWVDPQSELYSLGVRPGDQLTSYNGKPIHGAKDVLYAAMLEDKNVDLSGYHVNYATKEKKTFNYRVTSYLSPYALEDIKTVGIGSMARYLIYPASSSGIVAPLPDGSPMIGSGIEPGDRIVWADGNLLFSMDQLTSILNDGKALLTVKRGDKLFLSRQPRVLAADLAITNLVRNELVDWQYEAGLKGRWQDLFVLPYNLTADAVVENPMTFLDSESQEVDFPSHLKADLLNAPLQVGDKIIAVDGVPVTTAYQLLDLLQVHHVLLIVKRETSLPVRIWSGADTSFINSFDIRSIAEVAHTIGLNQSQRQEGEYVLLQPVEPKRVDEFNLSSEAKEQMMEEASEKRKEISEIRDSKKRNRTLQLFEESQNRYLLGIYLQDELVRYNPSPLSQFISVFKETWQTLKALIFGYLNPKWISGPVGIVQVLHRGWQIGIGEALFWVAAISINLGVLNLLPIPVLDGGYVCLSLWELITRKPIKAKTLERLIIPFVVLLILLLIFLTFQDVLRLF